jgi:septum formation protein
MRTILASASPTRRKIFENLGVKFEIIPSDFDEKNPAKFSTKELVKYLAEGKAKSVYKKFEQENNFIVLGFDSLVELDGEIIGKLKTKKSALETFQKYRGRPVALYTGISIIGKFRGKFFQATDYEVSYIHFKADTTNCQIRDFLNYNDWQGKAGGIAVEGATQFLVEKIEGDWNNILGVPVLKMNQIIRENLGKPPIKIFEKK